MLKSRSKLILVLASVTMIVTVAVIVGKRMNSTRYVHPIVSETPPVAAGLKVNEGVWNYEGFDLFVQDSSFEEGILQLKASALRGSVRARLQLLCDVDFNLADQKTLVRLSSIVIGIVTENHLYGNDAKIALDILGHCYEVDAAAEYLRRYAMDAAHTHESRCWAIMSLGEFLAPNELHLSHPARYCPNQETIKVIRHFIQSPDEDDVTAGLSAVRSGHIEELRGDVITLKKRHGHSRQLQIDIEEALVALLR